MGKLKAYLSQAQDFISDIASRNVVLNDLYQEALETLFNDNKEPLQEAVVLKVFPQNQTAADIAEGKEQYQSAILRIPRLHDCIPDPVRILKETEDEQQVNNIIELHGAYFSKDPISSVETAADPSSLLKVGDIVSIQVINGIPRIGEVKGRDKHFASLSQISPQTLNESFSQQQPTPLSDLTSNGDSEPDLPPATNMIEELERKIPVTQGLIQYPSKMSYITKKVQDESLIWKNKKEKDPTVYDTLKKYWEYVGWNEPPGEEPTWTPSGKPWSSAFISWIVGDDFFPKSSAHYRYSRSSLYNREDKKGQWWLFSLKREKVKINIGDIFVKTRSDGTEETYRASHGDIVWKIENNIAYLAGGNLGDSMNKDIKITLNSDGTPKSTGRYEILVKRVE